MRWQWENEGESIRIGLDDDGYTILPVSREASAETDSVRIWKWDGNAEKPTLEPSVIWTCRGRTYHFLLSQGEIRNVHKD